MNHPFEQDLPSLARAIRRDVIEISYRSKSGHIGSALSAVELLTTLVFRCLKIDPSRPDWPERDRFILGKGHAAAAYYACLCRRGFMTRSCLDQFGLDGGSLRHHPDRCLRHSIEVTTGSLGHGLGVAAGMAYGARLMGQSWRTFVLLSDGELNEGSIWEAAMFAAHHGLDSLTALVDCNQIQALGHTRDVIRVESLEGVWSSLGWFVQRLDGHDEAQILRALEEIPWVPGKPSVILADTIKGKGISFMEGKLLWHYRCPDEDEYARAIEELESHENDHR